MYDDNDNDDDDDDDVPLPPESTTGEEICWPERLEAWVFAHTKLGREPGPATGDNPLWDES